MVIFMLDGDSGGITFGIEMAKSVFGISHEKLLEDIMKLNKHRGGTTTGASFRE